MRTLLLAALPALALSTPALAQDTAPPPTLSLSASADVMIEPEYATIRSGVEVRADTARDAVRQNAALMDRVFRALRDANVASRDMQTANLTVQPVYEWIENRSERRLVGYTARNIVSAKVRNLDAVGDAIDAMVEAGANNIEGVSFGADDTAEDMDRARLMAVERLMEKAELYAGAANLDLCGIRRMSESSHAPQPVMANDMVYMARAEAADTPVAAGELTLRATVSADFCIEN